jgi:hypothetical protein
MGRMTRDGRPKVETPSICSASGIQFDAGFKELISIQVNR